MDFRNLFQALSRKPVIITHEPAEIHAALFPRTTVTAAFLQLDSAQVQNIRDLYTKVVEGIPLEALSKVSLGARVLEKGQLEQIRASFSPQEQTINLDERTAEDLIHSFDAALGESFVRPYNLDHVIAVDTDFHAHFGMGPFATMPLQKGALSTQIPSIEGVRSAPPDSIFFGSDKTRHRKPPGSRPVFLVTTNLQTSTP